MEVKYFVKNPNNYEITLSEFGIAIPANGEKEIPGDFARILQRQFEVRKITLEGGKEIDNVNLKDFLDNSERIKQDKYKQAEEAETMPSTKRVYKKSQK